MTDWNRTERTRPRRTIAGRWIFAATVLALLSGAGGSVVAHLVAPTPVGQEASFYEGGSQGVPHWPVPTLSVAVSPTATCTNASVSVAAAAAAPAPVAIVLSASGPGGRCGAGDFAELFRFAFATNASGLAQSDTVTVTTEVGTNGSVRSSPSTVVLTTPTSPPGPYRATLELFVDFGAVNPPAGGIAVLDLVVQ